MPRLAAFRVLPLIALLAVDGCAVEEPAAEDAEFVRDYTEDPETDVEEEQAEAALEAELDGYDELDEIEQDEPVLAPKAGTRPARKPHGPVSILQDDAYFLWPDAGRTTHDNFMEARQIGADVIRVFVGWKDTLKSDFRSTERPAGNLADPGQWDWSRLDTLFDGARTAGLRVMITLGSPLPYWASEDPARCVERESRVEFGKDWCSWKPRPRDYAMWVTALGRHLKLTQRIPWGMTLWNEPNLSFFLADEDRHKVGVRYRKMFFVGFKALRKTAGLKTRVFFGDFANGMTTPAHWTTFHYSLCLPDPNTPNDAGLPHRC